VSFAAESFVSMVVLAMRLMAPLSNPERETLTDLIRRVIEANESSKEPE
jgi:hypothetical protein